MLCKRRKLGGGSFGEIFLGELGSSVAGTPSYGLTKTAAGWHRHARTGRVPYARVSCARRDVALGVVHAGTNTQSGEEVGVKLESVKARHPQLLYESKLYKILQGGGRLEQQLAAGPCMQGAVHALPLMTCTLT